MDIFFVSWWAKKVDTTIRKNICFLTDFWNLTVYFDWINSLFITYENAKGKNQLLSEWPLS